MLALVTADVAAAHDPDLEPLRAAVGERIGHDRVGVVSWDDPQVDWAGFEAAVIRSTWDYHDRLDEFLEWLDATAAVTRVANPPAAVRWSTDKRYLGQLAAAGIPVTPTRYVAPGEPVPPVEGTQVVKPSVGAGSNGARRCEPGDVAEHVAFLHARGLTAMVQPYLGLLDDLGETGLCLGPADGGGLEISHSFRKGAILRSNDVEREGDLFAKEDISACEPSVAERRLVGEVLGAVPDLGELLYARVDVAPIADDRLVVMELELIEPSFYFATAPGSVDRFADALLGRLGLGATADAAGER